MCHLRHETFILVSQISFPVCFKKCKLYILAISCLRDALSGVVTHFSTAQHAQNQKNSNTSRIRIGRLIDKRVSLYNLMSRLHSISTLFLTACVPLIFIPVGEGEHIDPTTFKALGGPNHDRKVEESTTRL